MKKNFDYAVIKALLDQLLVLINLLFTAEELREIQEYIDVGEYGLALHTIVDILIEEGKIVPGKVLVAVEELAVLMQISDEIDFESIRRVD